MDDSESGSAWVPRSGRGHMGSLSAHCVESEVK